MDERSWERVSELFEAAVALPEAERAGFLDTQCGADGELRRQVERLLAADQRAGGFLERPAASYELPLPAQIGRYEIVRPIGRGGLGVVLEGWDPVLRRAVAVKTSFWASEAARRRFAREAEIAARLDHPNITTVFDSGVADGSTYLVQELLSGEDLAAAIERGEPVDLTARLRILIEIARGLAYAHAQGVLHRDLKPGNVRLLEDGRVKIMDFGIASLLGATRLTTDGSVFGTAAYMAPEQVRGSELDARADVYAFGALAFELLSGAAPFTAEAGPALLYQVLEQPPPALASRCPDCPPRLAGLIDRCLAKDPRQRPGHFEDVLAELEAVTGEPKRGRFGLGRLGRGLRPRWRRAAATAAVLVLGAVGGARLLRSPPAVSPSAPIVPLAQGLLAIDAVPWAAIREIRAADGARVPVEAEAVTPLSRLVPPGRYRVALVNARLGRELACEAEVPAGGVGRCRAEVLMLEAGAVLRALEK